MDKSSAMLNGWLGFLLGLKRDITSYRESGLKLWCPSMLLLFKLWGMLRRMGRYRRALLVCRMWVL